MYISTKRGERLANPDEIDGERGNVRIQSGRNGRRGENVRIQSGRNGRREGKREDKESTMDNEQWHWQTGKAWYGIGIYHVTLTVTDRQPLLGELVIPENDPKRAFIRRTEFGEKVTEEALRINHYYPGIRVIQHCLMPDHLHVIYYVTKPLPKSIKSVIRGLWQGVKKIGRDYTIANATPLVPSELNSDKMDGEKANPSPIFTESPFIRPMSRRGQLQAMIRYVQMNPQRLATKRLMPGFFRVQDGIEIGGRKYRGIGNAALLQASKYAPVHVRRTMVEEAMHGDNKRLRDYMNGCVLAARNGAVMVSPFISDKEKEVMVVLLAEEHPIIYIADNGFRDYYKPSDGLFDAVAAGRVLILSPWEYDPHKKHVSRAECVAMNKMAEEICEFEINRRR